MGLFDRRSNWQEDNTDDAKTSAERRRLTDELNNVRRCIEEYKLTKDTFPGYDELQKTKREIMAQIATL